MTTHAPSSSPSVAGQVAGLPQLSMDDLWRLWDEYFDERPGHHHRGWLESRLAYKIQERAFGGLKSSLRKKLEEIGETGLLPKRLQGDAQHLIPGTVLTRIFADIEHRVLVHGPSNFEYEGQKFRSLTAVARHITGTQWSGPLFFGLTSRPSRRVAR